jgi:hypothetical protein
MQQNSLTSGSHANASDLNMLRDGCKTIMSILVILTNDCGKVV